jgi:signal transduction histidine kinase
MQKLKPLRNDTHAAVDEARGSTDDKLEYERVEADRAIEATAVAAKRETEETVQRTQREVDRTIDSTENAAVRAAAKSTEETSALQQMLEGRAGASSEEAAVKAHEASDAERRKAQTSVLEVAERTREELTVERASVQDATERERAERKRAFLEIMVQERRETDEALGLERERSDLLVAGRDEILAMISHDLGNLIQAIHLKAVTLERALSGEALGARKLAEEIAGSCKTMSWWAGDLVDIASLDKGVLGLVVKTCSRAEIVKEPVQAFRSKAIEKGIDLRVHVDAPERGVRCDRGRVAQVLMNLLDNAIKFTPRAGIVTVRVEAIERQVCFSVSDTGPGIREEDRENVFERRWHAAPRTGGGAGLGLYISRRVIEALGGRIWVESAPERGSTFLLTLPDVDQPG